MFRRKRNERQNVFQPIILNPEIEFFFQDVEPPSFFDRTKTTNWLLDCIKKLRPTQQLTFIFCSDDYLLEINRSYLQHDYYTDIITFPLHSEGQPIQSDLFISLERVRENAKKHAAGDVRMELFRVMIHGYLHLCDYRDKTAEEKNAMRQMENEFLNSSTAFI